MTSTDFRPSRRTLVRGAAWSVPVISIAAAAPAFAASPCDVRTNETLDWDGAKTTYTRAADRRSSSAIYNPGVAGLTSTLTVGIAAEYVGNMKAGTEAGSTVNALAVKAQIGGLSISGVALEQSTSSGSGQGRSDRGSYTFSFTRPVSNLQFTITDIDSLAGDFWDILQLTPGYSVVASGASVSTDNGGPSGTQRFFSTSNDALVDNTTGNAGNLTLKYAGPISTFTLTYWNGHSGNFDRRVDTDQVVYLSDMTFDYKPCG